jgi:pimeloyl-ACP methyl ester carboxylesterase
MSPKRKRRIMRVSAGFIFLLLAYVVFCQCCMRMRWNDSKAYDVFKNKHAPLAIRDTVISGHHIHYAVTGPDSLPTLVFIHGSPGSWFHYMKFMYDSAMQTKFRLVSFDRPGFGYSDFGKAMHLQDQCKLLLPVLQKLKTDQPMFLCGHSMGGPVVAKLAADDPALFKTVVIVAGAIDPSQEKYETWRHIMKGKPMYWFLPGAFGPSNTELLYLKDDLVPLANDLKNIKCNILFVHGDKDTWVPIENIAYGKKMMVNAASINADTIRGADHQVPWKNREALRDILLGLN